MDREKAKAQIEDIKNSSRERIKKIEEKLRRDDSVAKTKERKFETRRHILLGAYNDKITIAQCLALLQSEKLKDHLEKPLRYAFVQSDEFKNYLIRPIDHQLFGLKTEIEVTKNSSNVSEKKTNVISTEPVKAVPTESAVDIETVADKESETSTKSEYHFEPRTGGGFYLDVDYKHRDIAKPFGAVFDKPAKKWYAPDGINPEPIQRAVDEIRNKATEK